MTVQLRDYQLKAIQELHDSMAQRANPCVVSPTGCHAAGSQVVMADLSLKRVEDVVVGDQLLGANGDPRTVQRLCRGTGNMYTVSYDYGKTMIVNEDHILSCHRDRRKHPTNISVRDYLQLRPSVQDTFKLYPAPPMEVPHEPHDLPIHPYILGQILAEYEFTLDGTPIRRSGVPDHKTKLPVGKFTLDMLQALSELKVRRANPHIPQEYLRTSLANRRELLAGLLRHRGKIEARTTLVPGLIVAESLRDDVCLLARTVGFRPTRRDNAIVLTGNFTELPTHRVGGYFRPRYKFRGHYQFGITELGPGAFYGFELDGDHLYLTDDWIVTHNSGKTLIIKQFVDELLANDPELTVAVVTHRLEILNNLRDTINNDAVDFVTVQKLTKTDTVYDVLIVDECHHVLAATYRKMIKQNCRWHCGFTATPLRGYMPEYANGTPLLTDSWRVELSGIIGEGLYDKAITTLNTASLIEEGFLCNYKIIQDFNFHIHHVGSKMLDYSKKEIDATITVGECVNYIHSTLDDKQGIVFCHAVDFATELADRLGDIAVVITSKTSKSDREAEFERFKAGEVKLLVSVDIFSEGVDVPAVDCVYLFRPTRSLPVYFQQIGRSLRPSPGKELAIVYDYVNNLGRLGTEPKRVKLKDMLLEGSLTYEVCEVCKARGVVEGDTERRCHAVAPPQVKIIKDWLYRNAGLYEWVHVDRGMSQAIQIKLSDDTELPVSDLFEYLEYIDGNTFPTHRFAVIRNVFGNWELQTKYNVARATEFKSSECLEFVGGCKYSSRKHLFYLITDTIFAERAKRKTPTIKQN